MPTLSRYYVRSAFICLLIGFTLGSVLLTAKSGLIDGRWWVWLPIHIALLLTGWLIQLSLGVGYWILPRIIGFERGRKRWAWASFIAFQMGNALLGVSILRIWWLEMTTLIMPGLALQGLAVLLLAVHAWPRIHPTIVRQAQTQAAQELANPRS